MPTVARIEAALDAALQDAGTPLDEEVVRSLLEAGYAAALDLEADRLAVEHRLARRGPVRVNEYDMLAERLRRDAERLRERVLVLRERLRTLSTAFMPEAPSTL